jgi:aspartate-semialdehyde dehydrogenase
MNSIRMGIVGATGLGGKAMREILDERSFAVSGSRKAAPSRARRNLSPAAGYQPESTLELATNVALIGEHGSERGLHQGNTTEQKPPREI